MGYKENRKREMERWGSQSNGRISYGKELGKYKLTGKYGKCITEDFSEEFKNFDGQTYGPDYCRCRMDTTRLIKMTPDLVDYLKTVALITSEKGGEFLLEGQKAHFSAHVSYKLNVTMGITLNNTRFYFEMIKVKKPVWRVHFVKMEG
jgi:hypothetical protein